MGSEETQPPEPDEAQVPAGPAEPPQGQSAESEPVAPQPAPTALGRNYLLLVIILITVLLAWVLALLSGQKAPREAGQRAPEGPQTPSLQTAPEPSTPAMPPGETPSVLKVVGSGQEAIAASPAQALEAGGPVYRLARLFDISRRSGTFRMEGLIRFSGQWADQRETLSLPSEAGEVFVAPGEAQHLRPEERVVVLRTGGQTRVYAVPVLRLYAGVEDAPGGVPVLVSWHFFPQAASCLVARAGDGRIHWRDAGLLYRGAEVVHDRETGSLWDALRGQALTGPRAGESVPTLPVEVWPWEAWRTENPETKVLATTPDGRIPSASPAPYLASVYLPPGLLAYEDEDGPLPAKQFVLGLVFDGGARAYPLTPRADGQQGAIVESVAGRRVEVHVTSPRTGYAQVDGEPAGGAVMLWFAWRELHPGTSVYFGD